MLIENTLRAAKRAGKRAKDNMCRHKVWYGVVWW